MAAIQYEPWEFASLEALLEIAAGMEQEAIAGYVALAQRMAAMARPDLAKVFEDLVQEETRHLDKVHAWSAASDAAAQTKEPTPHLPPPLFDDEGAGLIAPELLSAYRAFSIAVRNEERAFLFWTYVSAHAVSDEIRQAAERMAREELGHVATLRRERRTAFHSDRAGKKGRDLSLASLEDALAQALEAMAAQAEGDDAIVLLGHASSARARQASVIAQGFEAMATTRGADTENLDTALPLVEYLLDRYLDLGDHSRNEGDAGRARMFSGQLISCLRGLRDMREVTP